MFLDYSDVTFLVDGQQLHAHRVILAARSDYFRAMLYGQGFVESEQKQVKIEVPYKAFKALIQYIYSGILSLNKMDSTVDILDVLGLSNQYGFTELEDSISDYLREILSIENVCPILDSARLFSLESLISVCHFYMDRNAVNILKHESFSQLSEESLCNVLKRDSFYAPEVNIYKAVASWFKFNPSSDIQKVLSLVRLPLIDISHLLEVVRPSGILESDYILDAIAVQTNKEYLNYRGALVPDENIATIKYGARVVLGKDANYLLDGDTKSYDMENGYTSHLIDEGDTNCIIVELGGIYIINHVQILLWDRDVRSYAYYLEVSVNKEIWKRVVDYSNYKCRSWQFLHFAPVAVKFIRLVGTQNTVNKLFHCVALEAYYVRDSPRLVNGLIAPVKNVATLEKSAIVVEGVSRTRNNLLNGDVKNYDWDSGYTCHQLNSGAILVQLGQPYYIGSCRLLLWDCDERAYSFYIQTSTDQTSWELAVDRRNVQLKSWQHFTFEPRPVVFIKIVGTYNSVNEIFHCVHFECPSESPKALQTHSRASSVGSTEELPHTNGQELLNLSSVTNI